MSKITNNGLTRSDTGCLIAVPVYGNSGRQKAKTMATNRVFDGLSENDK